VVVETGVFVMFDTIGIPFKGSMRRGVIAVHEAPAGWTVTKQPKGASDDPTFEQAVSSASGSVLVAHVRKRTVGCISQDNTHPFRRGRWVFAHNGTIERLGDLRAALDDVSRAELRGDTDSEVLFAFLLAKLASHPSTQGSQFVTDMVLARAIEELSSFPSLGSSTFLLSDGVVLYAHCHGRPLFLLERHVDSGIQAILVASEQVTPDEPWTSISEGTLLTVWRRPRLGWADMRGKGAAVDRAPGRRV
jgi:predicted glutamine amidotransferase